MHRLIVGVVVSLLVTLVALAPASDATGATDGTPLVAISVTGSPLIPGDAARIEVDVELQEPADLRLEVVDFDGRLVRELFSGAREPGTLSRSWAGRDDADQRVPSGPYRIVATVTATALADADGSSEQVEAWVTVADRAVYPRQPAFITVAVDPGHGGSISGAVGADGTREADINLDIGLRLARMLEAAGVNVVITRSDDVFVNEPPLERTGDGLIDGDDELAARPDIANAARADLFLSIHNNIAVNASVGGPSTYYFDERPFGARSAKLARFVQTEMVAALEGISGDASGAGEGYQPYDHGVLIYPYYVLRGYDPPRLRRPTQMPGVLSEGMFLSNPRELRLLKRPAVRARMAAAYYASIARYLAQRSTHVGYELLEGPQVAVMAGETVSYDIEVRNQGNEAMRGWRFGAAAFPAPEHYIGRIRKGRPAGEVAIPQLAPGESVVVSIDVETPASGGDWMLLFDALDRDGRGAARDGSPMLQISLRTLDPPLVSSEPLDSAAPAPVATKGVAAENEGSDSGD